MFDLNRFSHRMILGMILALVAIIIIEVLFPKTSKDISTAINGHIEDAVDRVIKEDEFIGGYMLKRNSFFEDPKGEDIFHWAEGTVEIRIVLREQRAYIQLGEDFNSGPLPDGHVYISTTDFNIQDESDFNFDNQIDLGKLKKGNGASYYEIPRNINPKEIASVTIWCKAFGEYIGSANV